MNDVPSATPNVLTENEAMQIVAFLVSAAELCIKEPTYYGTFRLIDAASRLIGFMLEHDPPNTSAFLRDFKEELDTKKVWMMWDREAYFDFLRSAPAQVAAELRRLTETEHQTAAETAR